MTSQATKEDVVDLLVEQHQRIKTLLNEFGIAPAEERQARFEEIVRLLAVHESAEELVVHPAARDTGEAVEAAVELRLAEEREAKQMMAELYDLGTSSREFPSKFHSFAQAVMAHANLEEEYEFPQLRQEVAEDKRQRMARMLRAAERIAPTRPHPGVGASATANLLAGPPLAVFDRVRDTLREFR
jgi:hemerythrin superfamily protein